MRQRHVPLSIMAIVMATALMLDVPPTTAEPARPTTSSIPPGTAMKATTHITADHATVIDTTVKPGTYRAAQGVVPSPKPTVPRHILDAAKGKPWSPRPHISPPGPARPPTDRQLNHYSFEGLNAGTSGVRPPDPHGAVGLNHFVEVTNGPGLGIFEKSSGKLVRTATLNDFFRYTNGLLFHSRVVYDRAVNRWVIFTESLPQNANFQFVFLAVSKTPDPLGEYWKYAFDVPEIPGDYFDYPQLGVNQDALIITANIFTGDTYVRSRAFGIPKNAAYNGQGWNVPYFDLGTPGTVAPPIVEGFNPNAYLMSVRADRPAVLRLFRAIRLGFSDASIAFQADIHTYDGPIGYAFPLTQPGTDNYLSPGDGRFQNASTQIGNHLVNVHTGDRGDTIHKYPKMFYYQVDARVNRIMNSSSDLGSGINPSVAGSSFRGSREDPIGAIFFTWTDTHLWLDPPHQARVIGVVAEKWPPSGGDVTLAEAPTFYDPSPSLVESWGAYSAVSIDPVAPPGCSAGQRAWLVNERHISKTVWGTRIGYIDIC
jgi:hypothetical protein